MYISRGTFPILSRDPSFQEARGQQPIVFEAWCLPAIHPVPWLFILLVFSGSI